MPKPVVQKITQWSFSRFKDWQGCPRKAKYKHVDKIKEPGSAAMQRGSDIHKMAEDFLSGKLKVLPKELSSFEDEMIALRKRKPAVEADWAFDRQWQRVGWFDKEVWVRIKTDAASLLKKVVDVIDHKTGKEKPDHKDQMSLYGIGGFIVYPTALIARAKLWYLDLGKETVHEFERAELSQLKEEWEDKVQPMLNDARFAAKPSHACTWCHFRKSNGGPCEF